MKKYILIGIAALGISAVAAFLLLREKPEGPAVPGADAAQAAATEDFRAPDEIIPTIPETVQISEEMRGYENTAFRFALQYPEEMQVREYKENGGALSVIFDMPEGQGGFQIYVTPYKEEQVTKEQFVLDQPSGVMLEPADVIISGVQGTIFFGENSVMGETREVWFINNGFLYEVVTYKALDASLAAVMQTWRFIND